MSSDEIAIRVRDVSKHYLLFGRPQDRLKQSIVPRLQRLAGREPKRYYRDFAALSHVSFDVRRGETVGVIGRNGSGKSTLLQVICGTLRPNAGHVEVNGRIAALLELGAGFNPEFTGRENVYLNAAILGLPRGEIDARFADIAAFADIGDFIEQPVKTYSSGMYVRLAFATAINVDPDILVVDEALAVGDEAFQRKCFARIEQIQERGGTILFVTHAAQTVVQLCSRALLFDGGKLILDGQPKLVTSQYSRLLNAPEPHADQVRAAIQSMQADPVPNCSEQILPSTADLNDGGHGVVYPQHFDLFDKTLVSKSIVEYDHAGARISRVRIESEDGALVNVLRSGGFYNIAYEVFFQINAANVAFGTGIKSVSGMQLAGISTRLSPHQRNTRVVRGETVLVKMKFCCLLNEGTYFVNCGVRGLVEQEDRYLHRIIDAVAFKVVRESPSMCTDLVDLGFTPQVTFGRANPGGGDLTSGEANRAA